MSRDAWTPEDGATAGAVACVTLEASMSWAVLAHTPVEMSGLGVVLPPLIFLLVGGFGAYALGCLLARARVHAALPALFAGVALGLINRAAILLALCLLADLTFADLQSAVFFVLPGAVGGLGIGVGAACVRPASA